MGAWSPAFYSDDLVLDVRGDYGDLLRIGMPDDQAEELVVEYYRAAVEKSPSDEALFWIALAVSEWNRGRLSSSVRERALHYLQSGADLERYRQAGNERILRQDFICQGEILLYSKKACVPITAHMLFQLKYQYFEAFV